MTAKERLKQYSSRVKKAAYGEDIEYNSILDGLSTEGSIGSIDNTYESSHWHTDAPIYKAKATDVKDSSSKTVENPVENAEVILDLESIRQLMINSRMLKTSNLETIPESSSSVSSTVVSPANVASTGKERMQETMAYLQNNGFSRTAAAGIAGVLFAESDLIAGRRNEKEYKKYGDNAGIGIAQWSNERAQEYRNFMKGKETNLKNELDFLILDISKRPLVMEALKNATTVEDATDAVFRGFENGSAKAFASKQHMIDRYTKANEKLGIQKYSYDASFGKRAGFAKTAFNLGAI